MSHNKILILTEDEHAILSGLLPMIIKDSKKNINDSNKKALTLSLDILEHISEKLKKIK